MKKGQTKAAQAAEMRRLAEQRLRARHPVAAGTGAERDTLRLLHELQVHQVELEMQNEELGVARESAEAGLERYRDLYDFAPVGYFTLTRDGHIVEVNLTGAALLGTARAGLLRRGLGRFVARQELARWDQHLVTVLDSAERQTCELPFLRKDGSGFHARLDSIRLDRPVPEGRAGGPLPAMRVAMTDITERKLIEDTHLFLSQSGGQPAGEDFFRALARYLSETLAMDFVRAGRLVGGGLAAETLAMVDSGVFRDNVEYTLKDTPCGDVVGKTVCCFPAAVRRLYPKDEVLQQLRAESYVGATLWGFDGRPIGLIAVIGRRPLANPRLAELVLKAVSFRAAGELQRAQAEKALRASEARHRSFSEVTGQLGWTTDAAGEVTEDLPAWRKFTGQTTREVQGRGWLQALHPDDVARTAEVWRRAVVDKVAYEAEYRIRRADGVYRHFLARGVPVLRDDGTVLEWVGTCIDISDRKQAEEALRRVAEELERSNKDLEQFATVASHDLQEPLRAVSGYAHLLQERCRERLDEQAQRFLQGTVDGAARMQRLIDDLLAFSRVGTGGAPLQLVEAGTAAGDALANLATAIAEAGAVVACGPLPRVRADPRQLTQLFQNLVGNALKFRGNDAPRVDIGAVRREGRWLFSVRDNGIGIDPRERERIFEIFLRLNPRAKYPGTGIGLAICKRIVERHGGHIWVESEPGGGATFLFTLPDRDVERA